MDPTVSLNDNKCKDESVKELVERPRRPIDMQAIQEILDHMAARPRLDNRTPDEILGYDENGLPT